MWKYIDASLHIFNGSVEIAPYIGLADVIFDLVSSVSTLFKNNLKEIALKLLVDERERHFEKNISELYDPDTMPKGLKDLQQEKDILVEKSYQSKPFLNDEEKLKCLFDMYADKSPESERLI